MMEVAITIFLFAVMFLLYKCVIQPKKLHDRYVKAFRQKGFKVYEFPFRPFQAPSLKLTQQDQEKGDAFLAFRTRYKQYDVVISNIVHQPLIYLANPSLIKDYYLGDQEYEFPKVSSFMGLLKNFTGGGGILFDEGKEWHRRRRILNRVFTFDIVKNSTGKIKQICRNQLAQAEQNSAKKVEKQNQT